MNQVPTNTGVTGSPAENKHEATSHDIVQGKGKQDRSTNLTIHLDVYEWQSKARKKHGWAAAVGRFSQDFHTELVNSVNSSSQG